MIYQLEYEEHDCEGNKFRFLQVTSYYSDGTSEDVFSKPSACIDVVTLSTIFKEKHEHLCKDRELPSHQHSLQHQIPATVFLRGRWLRDCSMMLVMLDLLLRTSNLIGGGCWLY